MYSCMYMGTSVVKDNHNRGYKSEKAWVQNRKRVDTDQKFGTVKSPTCVFKSVR